ncbi:MAG: lipoyl synthase, partial [bacterium]|nr:lipoyl synthase [bacterium]
TKKFHGVRELIHGSKLFTVCEEAACPNMAECWSRGTATIMIMGDICTRSCGFCNVKTGKPLPLDKEEPRRVAEALREFNLKYIVITSVDRDELEDRGAGHIAETIRLCKEISPSTRLEVLVPDFKGKPECVKTVCEAGPAVYAHNMETVARLHLQVRPQAKYWRSLDTLAQAKRNGMVVKSGIMVGLGETPQEVKEVMRDLADAGCDLLTIGQYMQPSRRHLPVIEYIHPDQFREYKEVGQSLGLKHVESGPLVRSSYKAETQEELMRDGALASA